MIVDRQGHPLGSNGHDILTESDEASFLLERLQRLEDAIAGWDLLAQDSQREFSRSALGKIAQKAREFYLANPMIRRALNVQRFYTFGQGISVKARDDDVNDVVQAFWDDPANQRELTSHQALGAQDTRLAIDGNLFLAFFTNRMTGRVRVRTIPFAEIDSVITDPDDRSTPWFYRRIWTERRTNLQTGRPEERRMEAYYPDWRYHPRQRRSTIGNKPVIWDTPIYHVAVNRLPDMQFGVSEVYAAIDWARAYKDSLEDDATRSRALARFVYRLTVRGGQRRVDSVRSKLATKYDPSSGTQETNPPPAAGSIAINTPGQELEPMRVAGATLPADHNRALRLFAAAALDLPETFFGDADVGNHATAQTLDRPTELKFRDRQRLWGDILDGVIQYQIEQSAIAPLGALSGSVSRDPSDPDEMIITVDADTYVDLDFPNILERDTSQHVEAVIRAATLGGFEDAGVLDMDTLRRLLLVALQEGDLDETIAQVERNLAQQSAEEPREPSPLATAVRRLAEAIQVEREPAE